MKNEEIKVLHCLNSMNVGGIESWLSQLVDIKEKELIFDFFLSVTGGFYDEKLKNNNCTIYKAPPIRNFYNYKRKLKKLLIENKYNVIHVHGSEFLGDMMKIAKKAGVPIRVSHCHNTVLARGKTGFIMTLRKLRKRYLERHLILKYSTDILACGQDAGRFLLGDSWNKSKNTRVIYCGVNTNKFEKLSILKNKRRILVEKFKVPADALIIGHVGSMGLTNQKNHPFMIEVMKEIVELNPSAILFLAGDGPQRNKIEKLVEKSNLNANVIMPGIIDEVPEVMTHLFDVNFLPSLWEGLPVAGLEAVASGLMTVCSDRVTPEYTHVLSDRVKVISLDDKKSKWAEALLDESNNKLNVFDACKLLNKKGFSIISSLSELKKIYVSR
jgi:glycosyltransferase EpsF